MLGASPPRGGIDPAALAAAALSATLTIYAPPGPWSIGSSIIGLTLCFLILGYDVEPQRDRVQSIGFAAVLALICILILGYPLEVICSRNSGARLRAALQEIKPDETISDVPPLLIVAIWFVLTAVVSYVDQRRHSPTRQLAQGPDDAP